MRMWRFVTTLYLWERYQFALQNKSVFDRLFLEVRFRNLNLSEGCCWRYRLSGMCRCVPVCVGVYRCVPVCVGVYWYVPVCTRMCRCVVSRKLWSTKHSTKDEICLSSDTEWHPRRRQPYNKVRMNVSLISRPQVLWYKEPTRCKNNNFINNFNQLHMFRAIISPILRSTRLCLQLVV